MTRNEDENGTDCRQCGTCCKKGGPSFHMGDRRLIDSGIIPGDRLFTIRKGEPAHENVQRRLVSVKTDIIKIKGKPGRWECCYYDDRTHRCGIYPDRPEECRVLSCRDTRPIEALHATQRLTRKDLLSEVRGIWELIEDHQQRCDYDTIFKLHECMKSSRDTEAKKRLREILAYDRQIRLTLIENSVAADLMDFLFGRPLADTLPPLGIQIQ